MIAFLLQCLAATNYLYDAETETWIVNTTTEEASMAGMKYGTKVKNLIITGTAKTAKSYFMSFYTYYLESLVADSLESFDSSAFAECKLLRYFRIPTSCKSIGLSAFEETDLRKIVIPKKWEHIGLYAFKNSNLRSVIIFEPGKKPSVYNGAFDAENLTEVVFCGKSQIPYEGTVFHPNLKTVLVSNKYKGEDFMGHSITKTDVSSYCNTINDEWFEDIWHVFKESSDLHQKIDDKSYIVVIVCFVIIIIITFLIVIPILRRKLTIDN